MINAIVGLSIAALICLIAAITCLITWFVHLDSAKQQLPLFILLNVLYVFGVAVAAYPLFILVPLIGELISRIG